MMVVLIISMMMAIAAPSLRKARDSSRQKSCLRNLRTLGGAMEQYALENRVRTGGSVAIALLCGNTSYLKRAPVCPSGGAYSDPLTVGTNPTCTRAADGHVLP